MSEMLANMEKLGSIDYSTEEQWTGQRWIDGKKIYQKTIDCGACPNSTVKSVAHNISNINDIIDVRGCTKIGTTYFSLPYVDRTNAANNLGVYANETTVYVTAGIDRSAMTPTYITLEYTKTTS